MKSISDSGSKVYRPTLEDLRRRAEQGGYGGGSGRIDTREWYELCYFEPLEEFLFKSLAERCPEMEYNDVTVCVSSWIYIHSVAPDATYKDVSDRCLRLGWLDDSDCDLAMKQAFERGYIFCNIDAEDPAAETIEPSEVIITLRKDIEEFLSELVNKECAASDAELIIAHGLEPLYEINEIHRRKQLEFEIEAVKFLYKKDERGQSVPLTEQEQAEWIESVVERNDRRFGQ
jgi:hypothetical protein